MAVTSQRKYNATSKEDGIFRISVQTKKIVNEGTTPFNGGMLCTSPYKVPAIP